MSFIIVSCAARRHPVANSPASTTTDAASKTEKSDAANKDSNELTQNSQLDRELAGGKADSFKIALAADQFLQLDVEQKGIDVIVRLLSPEGKELANVNNNDQGTETIAVVADVAGSYRIEVKPADDKLPVGHYSLKVKELRIATQPDKDRIIAQRNYEEGDQLVGQGNEESLKKALTKYSAALPIWRSLADKKMEGITLFSIGYAYAALGDTEKTLDYYNQSLTIRKAMGDRVREGRTLNSIGMTYVDLAEKEKALDYLNQALKVLQDAQEKAGQAEVLNNLGLVYGTLIGDKQKAIDYYNQAIPIAHELGDGATEGNARNNIGQLYFSLGDKEKALDLFNQAVKLLEAGGDYAGEANALSNLGALYDSLSEKQKALDYYNKALKIRRALNDKAGQAVTLSNMGSVYDTMGEKQTALDYFNQALPLRRAAQDKLGEASTLNNFGTAYKDLGETERALDYFKQALAIRQAIKDRAGETSTLVSIGVVFRMIGKSDEALNYLNQALSIAKEINNPKQQAFALSASGFAYAKLGQNDKAIDVFNQALALRQALGNRLEQARTLTGLGSVYLASNQSDKALEAYNQALKLSRESGYRAGEAGAFYGIARAERDRGNLLAARDKIEAALQIIESLRAKVISQELRSSYFASVQDYYEFYKDLLMRLHKQHPKDGYDAAALLACERARARSLLELLAESQGEIRQGADAELVAREHTLQQQLNARAVEQLKLVAGKHTDEQAAALAKQVAELEGQLQEAQTQLRQKSPRYAALTQPQPLDLKGIQQQALDDDTILLEYALGEERSYLWMVTTGEIRSFELPKRAEIEAAAINLHNLLAAAPKPVAQDDKNNNKDARTLRKLNKAAGDFSTAAAQLSDMIIKPVATRLGTKRLLIVGEGALQLVPFGALPSSDAKTGAGNQPLVVTHEITYLPSASTIAVLRRETGDRKSESKSLFVLADPVFDKNDERVKAVSGDAEKKSDKPAAPASARKLVKVDMAASMEAAGLTIKRLPFTRAEAQGIETVLKTGECKKAFDFQANRATLTSAELSNYRILHIATHGFLNFANPSLSGLVLSLLDEKGNPQDGFFLANEVFNLNLPVELVVLSACETGLGKQVRGEGTTGLTRGFMYAGAPRVVVSLWSIDDKATSELMIRFYQGMLGEKQLRPSAALREAQIQMWREQQWQSPYYWAAFELHGEWR
jgi:CHAT domain-containing protein/tetratricopeptide (TPR) repeat protein